MDKKKKINETHPHYRQKVVYSFEDEKVIALNKILNLTLKKKFDWFIEIKVIFLETSKNFTTPSLNGTIKVDEDWYGEQWREYHYSEPIPDPQTEDISIGDIIGGPTAYSIAEKIKEGLTITLSKNIESFQWINLCVRTEEKQDIIKEDTQEFNKDILNFLRRRYDINKIDIAGTVITQISFNNGEETINSLQNRKNMELTILYYLEDNGYIDINTFFSNERSPEMVSVIRTVRKFLKEVMP